ncbi:MAG: CoA-binding protein [Desulfovibrionaceae bacterium]
MHSDPELTALLARVKTVAVVGAVDKPSRPVDGVGRYLMAAGLTVIPVHPKRTDVWGLPTYPDLASVPVPIDLVDLFRAPEHIPAHAREVLALAHRPLAFWMQQGVTSPEAEAILAGSGIAVIQDRCLAVAHRLLLGGRDRA